MKVSVVIPVFPLDEEIKRLTQRAVQSFQETATDLEMVVVEGAHPFARNVNTGLAQTSGEIVVVCNNDAVVLPGWKESLLGRVAEAGVGVASFTPRPDCGWCFGVRKDVLEKVGPLDERLVNSYEDYDLFIRCALVGLHRSFADDYFAVHEGGGTLNKVWGPLQAARRIEQCEANKKYMQQKWPGLDVSGPAGWKWTSQEVEIMREWKRKYGRVENLAKN